MSDVQGGSFEATETPVNPYSLLEAVNSSSETAHTSWLIFLGLTSYLLIAVAGVSHKNLLLNSAIPLPILQVQIELVLFFLFAPIVLVLFHLGVITQLVMLARKAIEFDTAMRLLEVSDRRTHPLRLELNNFFFVQAIAGPERSMVMALFLHLMTWLTLAILPVLLLLYIQTVFLPYHSVPITWAHRAALFADMALLILIGVFLVRAESSFFKAFFRTAGQNPISFVVTGVLLIVVTFFSLFIATVPGEPMARIADRFLTKRTDANNVQGFMIGTTIPFLWVSADGALFGLFHRNLQVTDLNLVVDSAVTENEPTLNLRGRDLRFARLNRSDLRQADLTGADLTGASLIGTDLRNAYLKCINLDALLGQGRSVAGCASGAGANFKGANLEKANLQGMDLQLAVFEGANLAGARLADAAMAGANFRNAHLDGADLTNGVSMRGAQLDAATLQGANLRWADLQGANLNNADLRAAQLSGANLEGATLIDSRLEGADLSNVRLRGANLDLARIAGADLRGAVLWQTIPPPAKASVLADLSRLEIRPPDASDVSQSKAQF